jgi:Ca2+-binding EF-hand superfamily protein
MSNGGGFLREVLHGGPGGGATSGAAAGASPATANAVLATGGAVGHRLSARNSQAVKVILSEAYIRWCSEPETSGLLETLCREMLAASRTPHSVATAPSSSSGGRAVGQQETAGSRHSDPLSSANSTVAPATEGPEGRSSLDVQRSTSPSPPPSPPMRQRQRKEEDRRTPSPIQHHTRFLGVDELDSHHRLSSPGAASPVSPTNMPVVTAPGGASRQHHSVDPPPHLPAAQHANGGHVGSALDTAAFFGDANSPGATGRGSSPTDHGHKFLSSGASSFAVLPNRILPVATVHDVPLFFHKTDPEGCLRDVNIDELDALATAFSSGRPSTSSRTTVGGKGSGAGRPSATLDIDVNKTVRKNQFSKICKDVFAIPIWLKDCLYRRIAVANGLTENQPLNYHFIKKFYDTAFGRLTPNRRIFELIRQNPRASVLTLDDLKLAIKYLVDTHPGLEFLKQPEFQDSYCRTVAIRMVYELERRHQRVIAWPQFDRSDLPVIMRDLDDVQDVNQVLRYFSYEHFYVLYCRFWELDSDRDQLVSLADLQQYSQGSLTTAVLQRVVSGAARKLTSGVPGKLDFEDFIYFCLSEEDKNHPQAIYYWFRALDVDCDGILSGYELGKFYEENQGRFMDLTGDDSLKFEDMLCQMLDMVGAYRVKSHGLQGVTLADLKACESTGHFFDMVFNASKFMSFEHRDPFAEHQQKLQQEKTDWDRFARLEYDRMANEVS